MSFRLLFVLSLSLATASCGGAQATPETPSDAPKTSDETNTPAASPPADEQSGKPAPEIQPIAPGSRLSLWLPSEVERMGRAFVYRNANSNLVVALAELTATKGEDSQLVSGVIGGAQGLSVTSDEKDGELRKVVLSGQKTDREARMLILEQNGRAATIYVIFHPAYSKQADKILASAKLDPSAPLDPLRLHGLSLAPLGSMEMANASHQPVVLTRKGPKPPIESASAVAFISINPHNYGESFTDEQLGGLIRANIAGLNPNFAEGKVNEVMVSGRKAQELLLQGEKDGTPLAIYAYAIADGDCAIIAVAYVQMDRADQEMADIVPLLRSLKLGEI